MCYIDYPTAPFSSCSLSSDCSDSELSDSETSGDGVSSDSELSGDSLSLDSEDPGLGLIISPIPGNPGNGLFGSVGSVLSSGGAGGLICSWSHSSVGFSKTIFSRELSSRE